MMQEGQNLKENISSNNYSIHYGDRMLFQIRQIEAELHHFEKFEINADDDINVRNNAGTKLFEYCRKKSIVLSTDERDYDVPLITFLEEFGFKIKYEKIIFVKKLAGHEFSYKDILNYKSLEEIGKENFMKVFEQTTDVGEEQESTPMEFFNVIYDYAGDKFNPANYLVALHNGSEIGVLMPQVYPNNNREGTLFHLGVVPGERNKGYGKIMHSKGLVILKDQGVEIYIGSTNTKNKSMLRLFEANGCKVWFKRKFYYTG